MPFIQIINDGNYYTSPADKADATKIQNLFVITDYSGYDPEVNTGATTGGVQTFGVDRFTYPRARTFMVNLNFTF